MQVTLAPGPRFRFGAADIILDLGEVGQGSAPLVGRKACHLGMLLNAGFSVPRGFCVTTEVFRSCASGRLPLELREAIVTAWRRAGFRVAAVRSSATEEDGREASWAGIFPTVLPVNDEESLLAAVQECFQALHASEAVRYRRMVGDAQDTPAMAVLVQELVDAEAAGIMFTTHPVTGAREDILINSIPGLGEPLASGRMTGDSFIIGRDGRVKAETLTSKPFMLTGRGEVPLCGLHRERSSLTAAQLARLSRLALEIEAMFGCPQDIEFAIAGDLIYLLQARPIARVPAARATEAAEADAYIERERRSLAKRVAELRRQGRLSGADAVFSNGNIGELLPTPTPMSFGVFRAIFAGRCGAIVEGRRRLGYRLADDAAEPLYELICGQPSFNVEIDARTFDIGLPLDVADILARIAEDPTRANYPEFGLYRQCYSLAEAVTLYGAVEGSQIHAESRRIRTGMVEAAAAFLASFTGELELGLSRGLDAARQAIAAAPALADAELIDEFHARIAHLKGESCILFVMAARLGFFFADMVRWRLEQHLGSAALAAPLLQGLDGSRITGQALDLERLAHDRIGRPAFLESYGHMSVNELELSLPRLAEEPEALELLVRDMARSGRRPAEEFHCQQRQRLAAEADLGRRLAAAGVTNQEAAELAADLRLAQAFLPLRETVKYYYAAEYAVIRTVLREINRRLAWAEDDIFYLFPEELTQCFAATDTLARLIRGRRHDHHIARLLARQGRVPAVVFASRLEAVGMPPETAASRQLRGAPVAAGKAVGVVRLLDHPDFQSASMDLRGNEVIVTRSANLGLAPLLRMAAGLVVEVGGILAHAACQARESGIPAVVLAGATAALRDGVMVRIDGGTGLVEVLDERA